VKQIQKNSEFVDFLIEFLFGIQSTVRTFLIRLSTQGRRIGVALFITAYLTCSNISNAQRKF